MSTNRNRSQLDWVRKRVRLIFQGENQHVTLYPLLSSSTYTLGDSQSDTVWIADNDPFIDPEQKVWIGRVDHSVQENSESYMQWNGGSIELLRSIADAALTVGFTVTGSATLNEDYAMFGPVINGNGQINNTKLAVSSICRRARSADRESRSPLERRRCEV
jgi:hypothetical protein